MHKASLILFLLSFSVVIGKAQQVDSIISKVKKQLYINLSSVNGLEVEGKVKMENGEVSFTIQSKGKDVCLTKIANGEKTILKTEKGIGYKIVNEHKVKIRVSEVTEYCKNYLWCCFYVGLNLYFYKEDSLKATLNEKRVEIDNATCYQIDITANDKTVSEYYIQTNSYHIVKEVMDQGIAYYNNYIKVNDNYFPTVITIYSKDRQRIMGKFEYTKIKIL